jgi:hypothetical protein
VTVAAEDLNPTKESRVSFPYGDDRMEFYCPGCNSFHWVRVLEVGWNLNMTKPSIFQETRKFRDQKNYMCEFTMQDGVLTYSSNSSHRLAAQSVRMEPYATVEMNRVPWNKTHVANQKGHRQTCPKK